MSPKKNYKEKTKYSLDYNGTFVIEGYNHAKPFTNFFPGIAGIWGIPMWVFYVNRGQGISSFGIESKDKSILEFQPANKAYSLTSLHGFRTFLKIKTGRKTVFWEPFQNNTGREFQTQQRMIISSHDLRIEDINTALGLKVSVNYFTIPEEPFAGLVRRLTVENLTRKKISVELIDGLPAIVPYGLKDWLLKHLSRTAEAWVKVRNIDSKAPFYQLNVEISDKPQVSHIKEGNFYFAFEPKGNKGKLLSPIVEASKIFGEACDFIVPENFLKQDSFKYPQIQQTNNRTPSAMSFAKLSLKAHDKKEIISVCGYAHEESQVEKIVKEVTAKGYIDKKFSKNAEIIESVKNFALTVSSSRQFDLYNKQTFLDNVLRGGLPVSLKTGGGNVAFNVFSRKHGDPERDYNHFVLAPTYFSQGNGNYRDVNQNRRNDIWFNGDVKDNIIINFLSLIQADGYNPLVVKGMTFLAEDSPKVDLILDKSIKGKEKQRIRQYIIEGFQPGELLNYIVQEDIKLKVPLKNFLEQVLGLCQKHEYADHGEGFWSDHWTYNIDLLESYLSLYPEQLGSLLLNKKVFSFYHNAHYVLPRDRRYILVNNEVRQYHSVSCDPKIVKIKEGNHKLRGQDGRGNIYYSNLMCKLLCIVANKVASLDPSGIGVEMEADKPSWYDALNGLPGLLGSSISETFELKRLSILVIKMLEQLALKDDAKIPLFVELQTFITRLSHILSVEKDAFGYWKQSNEAKEHYRYRIRQGIDGQENEITVLEVKKFLQLVVDRTNKAPVRAKTSGGLFGTYFYHSVTDYYKIEKDYQDGVPHVQPLKFKRHTLPLFLEGFVHALRVVKNVEEAKRIYQRVKKSPLFDKKLKMYKVNADLSKETEEIGRTRIFPRGWLENESVWLHMEYKFMLELLNTGLYEEFYGNLKSVFVPFLKPESYGRSTLENSSFIASSAHEDQDLHGQGFVARLSGSTAEVVHIWLLMNAGKQPFQLDKTGNVILKFKPALAGWLFTKKKHMADFKDKQGHWKKVEIPKNAYAFNFLSSTVVVYHNPKRKNTFGASRCRIKNIELSYSHSKKPVCIVGSEISSSYALDIRNNKVERIDVYFG